MEQNLENQLEPVMVMIILSLRFLLGVSEVSVVSVILGKVMGYTLIATDDLYLG